MFIKSNMIVDCKQSLKVWSLLKTLMHVVFSPYLLVLQGLPVSLNHLINTLRCMENAQSSCL